MKKVKIKPKYVGLFDRPELICFHYEDVQGLVRVVYFTFRDFREWVNENGFLTLDKEYHNLWSGAASNSSEYIAYDDFFNMKQAHDYAIQMAKLFFEERFSMCG